METNFFNLIKKNSAVPISNYGPLAQTPDGLNNSATLTQIKHSLVK